MKRKIKLGRKAKRAFPLAMAIMSSAGVIITGYEAAKATPRALQLIEDAKNAKGEDLSKFETFKAGAPAYFKTATAAGTTIALIAGTHIFNTRQQASLIGAAKLTSDAYSDYQNKTKELYGEEAHRKIVNAIAADKATPETITAQCLFGNSSLDCEKEGRDSERLFYEPISRKFFISTISKVLQAQYHLNRNFSIGGYAMLEDFYTFLGIWDIISEDAREYAKTVGWTISDGDMFWIDFDNYEAEIDGKNCYVIDCVWEPSVEYLSSYLE